MIKAFIPCAGLGSRMNMKFDESKEMLIDPKTGNPLIGWHLILCEMHNIKPYIITRKEKTDLIRWLELYQFPKEQIIIIEPEGEWMDTILKASDHFGDKNIVLLPDTKWSSSDETMKNIVKSLDFGCETVFGIHKVEDVSKWGYVTDDLFVEKPPFHKPGYAWGILAGRKWALTSLLYDMKEKGKMKEHYSPTNFVFMDDFHDLTRTGTILSV